MSAYLAENILYFGRVLRSAGMALSTERILMATKAVVAVGVGSPEDLRHSLRCTLTSSPDQQELFEQAFSAFWRDPDLLGKAMQMLLPKVEVATPTPQEDRRRLAEALAPPTAPRGAEDDKDQPPQTIEATLSFSSRELLQKADFESLSGAEWRAVTQLVARLTPQLALARTRRHQACVHRGQIHMRHVARRAMRTGGEVLQLPRRVPRERPMKVVALVDISGSMTSYSRMFLHFLHALTRADPRTQTLVFGTRLSYLTPALRERDADDALRRAVRTVEDWNGGTRIATSLERFNKHHAARLLGARTLVLLVTDGLERDDAALLGREASRLARRCRRLVWLNPLLRYAGFEAKASGIRALLPHVHQHLPVHNLQSLMRLCDQYTSGMYISAGTGRR